MARYDLPDEAWILIQPLLPAQPATPRAGRPWAEHRNDHQWYVLGAVFGRTMARFARAIWSMEDRLQPF